MAATFKPTTKAAPVPPAAPAVSEKKSGVHHQPAMIPTMSLTYEPNFMQVLYDLGALSK